MSATAASSNSVRVRRHRERAGRVAHGRVFRTRAARALLVVQEADLHARDAVRVRHTVRPGAARQLVHRLYAVNRV